MATCRADQQSQEREPRSREIALGNNLEQGSLKLERLTEVAVYELPQVVSILRVQREVQSERATKLGQSARRCAFPEHLLDGIAGDDVNHKEDEREDEPEGWKSEEKAFEEVAGHIRRVPMNCLRKI